MQNRTSKLHKRFQKLEIPQCERVLAMREKENPHRLDQKRYLVEREEIAYGWVKASCSGKEFSTGLAG